MVGASPSFSEMHVLRALIILNKKRTGRKRLVRQLGIGEGSVRTIIKKLKKDKYVASSRQGHYLTEKGKSHLQKYLEGFTPPEDFQSELTDGFQSILVIHNSADKIDTGMAERDAALKAGADGAFIITYKNNRLEFPTCDINIGDYPETREKLKGLNLKNNDAIVISFAKTKEKAEDGALTIALVLTR